MHQDKQIENYIYNTRNKLGSGTYGSVYAGINSNTNERIAIKILKKEEIDRDHYLQQGLANEVKIMKSLNSENIVKFIDICQSAKHYYLIQEYCGGGDLQKYIKKYHHLTETKAKEILIQILKGFQELIKYGIMHRDLKPANILINDGKFKIADFGLSKSVSNLNLLQQSCVGTPVYMSPQLLEKQMYTSKADIWSLGILYYYALYGKCKYKYNKDPWKCKSQADLVKRIRSEQIQFPSDVKVSSESKNFILCCLQISEHQRISWDQLFRHTLVKSHFNQTFKVKGNLKYLINDLRQSVIHRKLDLNQIFTFTNPESSKITQEQIHDLILSLHANANQSDIEYLYELLKNENDQFVYLLDFQQWFIDNQIIQDKLSHKIEIRPSFTNLNQTEPAITQVIDNLREDPASFKELFTRIDKSGDGQLDYEEFYQYATQVNPEFTEIQIRTIFIYFDINRDGSISLQEFEGKLSEESDIDFTNNIMTISPIYESIEGPGQKLEVIQRPFLLKRFTI